MGCPFHTRAPAIGLPGRAPAAFRAAGIRVNHRSSLLRVCYVRYNIGAFPGSRSDRQLTAKGRLGPWKYPNLIRYKPLLSRNLSAILLGTVAGYADNIVLAMWPFKKRVRQRRLEVRRNIPTHRGATWRRFAQAGGPGSVAIALGFAAVVAALTVMPGRSFPYRPGDVITKQYARVKFEAPSEDLTKQAREKASRQTPLVYDLNRSLLDELRARLESLPAEARNIDQPGEIPESLQTRLEIKTQQDLKAFAQYAEPGDGDTWRKAIDAALRGLTRIVILTPDQVARERRHEAVAFRLADGEQVAEVNKWETGFIPFNKPREVERALAAMPLELDTRVARKVRGYAAGVISAGQPTYRLSRERTDAALAAARDAAPRQTHSYSADDVIFEGGSLDAADLIVLRAEHEAWRKQLVRHDPSYAFRKVTGRVVMALLVVCGLCAYVALYQKRVVTNHMRGFALAVLMVVVLTLTVAMVTVAGWNAYLAAGMAMMGAVMVAVAYNRRFALTVGGALVLLLTIQLDRDVGFMLMLATPVAVSVLLLREIRTRSRIIKVGAVAAATAFVAAAITNLAAGEPFDLRLVGHCGWAAGGVMVMGFILQGILPMIERIFHIATAMTLLEWCDADRKLLKRLAMEAPGTFNHSLLLGTLCEAAAETIGANGLLARVGAYYHDIGKINKPEYFVENQFGSPSKHAKLSPAMSLLIITGHVKDGIEMAKEYGLPPVLHEFIAAHHGTTLVQYFYHAATEQQKSNGGDRPPAETEFRYPGPKPHSREVAILMLADATESSVRAMSDPTPARIEAQAQAILTDRLTDGQLDECDLTLQAAHKIEQSLVKSLCGIYHGRIAYPKSETRGGKRNGVKTAQG